MKTALVALALLAASLVLMPPAASGAASAASLTGVWQLVSYENDFQDGLPSKATLGEHPRGYLILTPGGRMMGLLEGEGRHPPVTDHDSAQLLLSLTAYTGTYTVEGDEWTTHVDAAKNPDWDGVDQVRRFSIDRDRLIVTTPWQRSTHIAGSPVVRARLIFRRIETLRSLPR